MTSPAGTPPAPIVVVDVQPQHSRIVTPRTTNTTTTAVNSEIHRLTFPHDFPPLPVGVTLISFSAWKERGICVEPRAGDPDELEVDTLGIPTVAMGAHKTDYCKTKTRRKRRKEEAKTKYLSGGGTLPWWVIWEENESVRIARPMNSSESRLTKFLAAASDFKTGRKWPPLVNNQIDPSRLWSMIEVFIGIEGQPKKVARPSRKKVFHDLLEDEDEDSDDDFMDVDDAGEDGERGTATVLEGKEKKTMIFLNDPERMVKIFLSSYIRIKGIIWSKINLEQTPRLFMFFLEFLLRSRLFPRFEPEFRAAVEVTKQALIELPLTGILSGTIPDEFSKGCRECWGAKSEVFRTLNLGDEWEASLRGGSKATEAPKEGGDARADGDIEVIPEPEQQEEEAKPEEVKPDTSGWGDGGSTIWGNADAGGDDGWGAGVQLLNEDGTDLISLEAEVENPWTTLDEDRPFLMRLLGPSLLPLTHTTGIVEHSLRRVTDLIPVPTNFPPKPAISESDPIFADPAAVESDLEKTFPRVVFSPWLNWDGGEMPGYSDPRILETSQGPVVEPPYVTKTDTEVTTPKAHDPGNDPITVLVHPSTFDKLLKGMSVAGTWVQIVRQPVEPGDAAPKKKKKGKKKTPPSFWYLDEVGGIFPSYWTVKGEKS